MNIIIPARLCHFGASSVRQQASRQRYSDTAYRQYRVVIYPLSTNFASKTTVASSKDNVVATAMPVPLPTEQVEYDPSINQLLLETSHRSNVFVSPIIVAN